MIACTYRWFLRITYLTSLNSHGFLRCTGAQFGSVLRTMGQGQPVSWACSMQHADYS